MINLLSTNMENDVKKVSCPTCNWDGCEFSGTFYKVVDGKQVYDLSDWDVIETGLPVPEEYYPKMVNYSAGERTWLEIHFCPNCKKEFVFENNIN